jgi:hypothetical protein
MIAPGTRFGSLRRGATCGFWKWTGAPRYVAYGSDESGGNEVYVTTFPDPKEGKWPISSGGGYQPRWRRDGKELLYLSGDGKLMSVDVTLTPSFKAGAPKVLFSAPIGGGGANLEASRPIAVIVNWQAALKK